MHFNKILIYLFCIFESIHSISYKDNESKYLKTLDKRAIKQKQKKGKVLVDVILA